MSSAVAGIREVGPSPTAPWIDISVPLDAPGPAWPGGPGRRIETLRSVARGDASTDSMITMDLHCGTHIDAPAHLIAGAPTMGGFAPDQLCGRVTVVDARGRAIVEPDVLDQLDGAESGVLFLTDNSEQSLMRQAEFTETFVAISVATARALASRPGLRVVGNDYLSVQPFGGDREVHTALMDAGIAILEGIDLAGVAPGTYDMVGLALSVPSLEAAPARVLLRRQEPIPADRAATH